MMTEHERQQLREIERGLMDTDPKLVLLMSGGTYGRPAQRRVALLLMVDLLAIAMVVLAVATGQLALIFASSLCTLLAISMHTVRRRRARLV